MVCFFIANPGAASPRSTLVSPSGQLQLTSCGSRRSLRRRKSYIRLSQKRRFGAHVGGLTKHDLPQISVRSRARSVGRDPSGDSLSARRRPGSSGPARSLAARPSESPAAAIDFHRARDLTPRARVDRLRRSGCRITRHGGAGGGSCGQSPRVSTPQARNAVRTSGIPAIQTNLVVAELCVCHFRSNSSAPSLAKTWSAPLLDQTSVHPHCGTGLS